MIVDELKPVTRALQVFGFFIFPKNWRYSIRRFFFALYVLVIVSINVAMCVYNCLTIKNFAKHWGLMNENTISLIIQSTKPLHAVVNLTVFLFNRKLHDRLVQLLRDVDEEFFVVFRYRRIIRHKYYSLAFALCVMLLVPFAVRLLMFIVFGQKFGQNWLADISWLFIPLASLWQMLPLYYFYLTTSLLIQWFEDLYSRMENVNNNELLLDEPPEFGRNKPSYKDCVVIYHKISRCVFVLGSFFNPFVFFSVGISLAVLCIAIYYATGSEEAIMLVQRASNPNYKWYNVIFIIWTVIQVFSAMAYLVVFCINGWRTNEAARRISPILLRNVPCSQDLKILVSKKDVVL